VSNVRGDVPSSYRLFPVGRAGVDRKSGVDFWSNCRRCRASGLGARPDADVQVTSQDGSSIPGRSLRRKWLSSKYFRSCSITQDLVLHDVHSLETAMATDDARCLIYHFGRKAGA